MNEVYRIPIINQVTYVQTWGFDFADIYNPCLDNTYNKCQVQNRIYKQGTYKNSSYQLALRTGRIQPRYPITPKPCKRYRNY